MYAWRTCFQFRFQISHALQCTITIQPENKSSIFLVNNLNDWRGDPTEKNGDGRCLALGCKSVIDSGLVYGVQDQTPLFVVVRVYLRVASFMSRTKLKPHQIWTLRIYLTEQL